MKIGALCAGYGGLEMAVKAVFPDAEPAWFFEYDAAASKVLAHHYPDVPNYGDITKADWHGLEPVDIITAGFPCQDISNAGKREGINGSRSGIYVNVVEAVGILRPRVAFLENVAAIRTRGLSTVAQDLAEVGYDLKWTTLRASDVGGAHQRPRWFGLATPSNAYGARLEVGSIEPAREELSPVGRSGPGPEDPYSSVGPERRGTAPREASRGGARTNP